ncbi:MAG: hypothetical protein KAJ53_10515, partial [Anaerolineales bacterium]|nr:hypothetical protein [Anaerolineales bacterium]
MVLGAKLDLAAGRFSSLRILAGGAFIYGWWGVPDGTRDDATGELLHDYLLVSAAMCYALAGLGLGPVVETQHAASLLFLKLFCKEVAL